MDNETKTSSGDANKYVLPTTGTGDCDASTLLGPTPMGVGAAVDHVVPKGKWEFDAEVANSFEDMLQRSIPQYSLMRRLVLEVGSSFVKEVDKNFSWATSIVDLGCSRGEALAGFISRFGAAHKYLGVEVSPPMLAAARSRFAIHSFVQIVKSDLRKTYPSTQSPGAALTLAVLALQFIPIEYRQRIVRQAYKSTLPGGAFIVVEKVLGSTAELDALFVDRYYALKEENGYTPEDIERKRLSLEGVLVPVTARWNEELLRNAGFQQVDCFWRCLNFAAWVATKD